MRKLDKEPLGVDVIELPVLFALQAQGIKVVDGQQLMHEVQEDQDSGRDHAAQYGLHDGGFRLRRALPLYETWSSRK